MPKRTNRVAWGLVVGLTMIGVGGCVTWSVAQWLSIRREFQQWSLDESVRQAALASDPGRVQTLLAQGANVNAPDERASTPLLLAVTAGENAGVVRLLLAHGAEVNAKDYVDQTVLMRAAYSGSTTVARLLLHNGASVNARDNHRWTALTYAMSRHHTAVARLLKQAGGKE